MPQKNKHAHLSYIDLSYKNQTWNTLMCEQSIIKNKINLRKKWFSCNDGAKKLDLMTSVSRFGFNSVRTKKLNCNWFNRKTWSDYLGSDCLGFDDQFSSCFSEVVGWDDWVIAPKGFGMKMGHFIVWKPL